jgi:hypothetical protein
MHIAIIVEQWRKLIHSPGTHGVLVGGYCGATLPLPGMTWPCHATEILRSLLNE